MEESTICQVCQTENPAGSKFCHACGSRLTASSETICPECETPNPTDRVYCDNCGARLTKTASEEQEPAQPEAEPDAFSLPSREPGDTGELDPRALPDWLRTGRLRQLPEDLQEQDKGDSGSLPRIEDLTPEKKSTADLPDWLIADQDSEPIIEPPSSIDTERYLELLNSAEDEETFSTSEDLSASDASLPDWLTSDTEREEGRISQQDAADQDLSEWLSGLGRPSESAADIFTDSGDSVEIEEEGAPDWLSELGPPNTDILSSPTDADSVEDIDATLADEELPDWMAELGPADTDLLSHPTETQEYTSDEPSTVDEAEDWLENLRISDTSILSLPYDSRGEGSEEQDSDEVRGITDWLVDIDFDGEAVDMVQEGRPRPLSDQLDTEDDDAVAEPLPEDETADEAEPKDEEDEAAGATIVAYQEVPDWLTDSDASTSDLSADDDLAQADVEEETVQSDSEDLPVWLTTPYQPEQVSPTPDSESVSDFQDRPVIQSEEGLPEGSPHLMRTGPEPSSEEVRDITAVEESEPAEGINLPDWLFDAGLLEPGGQEGGVSSGGGQELELPDSGELPDWLLESEEAFSEDQPTEDELDDELVEEVVLEDDLDAPIWLTDEELPEGDSDFGSEFVEPEAGDAGTIDEMSDVASWQLDPEHSREESSLEDSSAEQPIEDQSAVGDLSEWVDVFEGQNAVLVDTAGEPKTSTEDSAATVEDDLAIWMDELESTGTGLLDDAAQVDKVRPERTSSVKDDISEWLAASDQLDVGEPALDELLSEQAAKESDLSTISEWFSEIDEKLATADSEGVSGEDLIDDLFASEDEQAATDLDWLLEPEAIGQPEDIEEAPAEQEEAELAADDTAGELDETLEAPLDDEPDWLGEFESLTIDTVSATTEASRADIDLAEETELAKVVEETTPSEEDVQSQPHPFLQESTAFEESDDDWAGDDAILDESIEPADVPDWLSDLGPPLPEQGVDSQMPEELASADELPEWVASLRPTTESDTSSLLPTALNLPTQDPEALADLTAEMGEPVLPEWLQGEVDASLAPKDLDEVIPDVPLQRRLTKSDEGTAGAGLFLHEEAEEADEAEWGDILGALPKAVTPEDLLTRAEIPDWVQKLKPTELSEEGRSSSAPSPVIDSGPLKGLRGAIDIEPIISAPHASLSLAGLVVTKEQQQQASLLRRLAQWEPPGATVAAERIPTISVWTRLLLVVLLFASIAAGLLIPGLLPHESYSADSSLTAVNTALIDAAGQPVLVAVEYTPAMAGELRSVTETMLAQLESNGSSVVVASQYTAGVALANDLLRSHDGQELGLIPGEAVGLRQLASCLVQGTVCQTLFGRRLEQDMQETLQDIDLIILLTGERDSLVNWVEQVEAVSEIPLVAGITQSLTPVAAPYLESGQLQGVIAGVSDTAAFQQQFTDSGVQSGLENRLQAQQVAQLVVAAILFIGAIINTLTGVFSQKSDRVTGAT